MSISLGIGGLSQPTVGRHVAQLESQLGTPLFERTGRGLVATPAAHRLADAARAMEAGAQSLLRGAHQSQTVLSGSVRLSASQPLACVLMPALLLRLQLCGYPAPNAGIGHDRKHAEARAQGPVGRRGRDAVPDGIARRMLKALKFVAQTAFILRM